MPKNSDRWSWFCKCGDWQRFRANGLFFHPNPSVERRGGSLKSQDALLAEEEIDGISVRGMRVGSRSGSSLIVKISRVHFVRHGAAP
jgi:hypothetical protein